MFIFEAISFCKLRSGYDVMRNKSLKSSRYLQVHMSFSFWKLQGLPSRKAWKANLLDTAVAVLDSCKWVDLFFLQLEGLGVGRVHLSQTSNLFSMQDIAIRDRIAQSDLFLSNLWSQSSAAKYRSGLKGFEKNTSTIHIIFAFKGCARAGTTPDNTVYEQYRLSWSLW